MITTTAARRAGHLPARFTKIGEIAYQVRFQEWVTVARFHSQTAGMSDAFFVRHDGNPAKEIPHSTYVTHVLASIKG